MSTVSLSYYKARQGNTWYNKDAVPNPRVMGYDNASYYDQGAMYQMSFSVTPGYTVKKLTFLIGNISGGASAFTNVYAVIYSYDPTDSFSNNTAPTNYSWRGSSYTKIEGDDGTSNIVVSVDVNITSSKLYYLFLTTDSGDPLTPFMRGGSNISCTLGEMKPETPATSVSVSTTPYMDQDFYISWSPYTSGYTYTVTYSFVNHSTLHTVVERTTANSAKCNVPSFPYGNDIPNSISGSFKVYVTSYNSSGTQVGQAYAESTLYIPTSNRAPTVQDGWASASYEVKAGTCVAGFSELRATVNTSKITCNYGSTLREIRISCNSTNLTVQSSGTFNLGKAISGNNVVTITVYDSRGLNQTYTKTIVGEAYSPPSFNSLSVIRCDASGNGSSSGTYYAVTPSVSHTSYDENNWLLIKTRWQVFGGSYSGYTDIQNNVKSDPVGGGNIATTASYLIEVMAIDSFGQTSIQTRTLTNTSVAATLNLKSNGLGAAFFGLSSNDNELTVFGRVGVTPTVDDVKFEPNNYDGAMLLSVGGIDRGGGNGIYKGNGDGIKMGADGFCNIAIKSWYGVGFVDGNGTSGVAAGVDCRLGDVYARRDLRAGSWVYGQRLQIQQSTSAMGNGVVRIGVNGEVVGNSSWIGARDQALVRNPIFDASKQAFWPITSSKCNTGTWDVGTLGDDYYFSYAADTDYTSGKNDTKRIVMSKYGDLHVPVTVSAANILAGDGGFFLSNLGASSGTAEPSGWSSGKLYFQYS